MQHSRTLSLGQAAGADAAAALLSFLRQQERVVALSPSSPRRVAVIGSGIAGLSAAWSLSAHARVTLFEAADYFGGHTHTVDVELQGQRHGVDTGFLVFNERTYPLLIALFEQLGVEVAASEMSFSVQLPEQRIEWSGTDINGVFAQRANLLRPRFWGMLAYLLRFNRLCTALASRGEDVSLAQPMGASFPSRKRTSSPTLVVSGSQMSRAPPLLPRTPSTYPPAFRSARMFSRNLAGMCSLSARRETETIGDSSFRATPSRMSVRSAYSPRLVSFTPMRSWHPRG